MLIVLSKQTLLAPFLHRRPNRFEVQGESPAEQNWEPLIASRVRVLNLSYNFDAFEMLAISGAVAAQDDHGAAVVIARSPIPVALVIAYRFGKSIFGTEEVDGPGFTVIIGEYHRACALFWRERVVHGSDFAHHAFPTKFVGKILRKRTIVLVLSFHWLQAGCFLIANECFRREDRRRKWEGENSEDENQRNVRWTAPMKTQCRSPFERNRAGGKQHWIGSSKVIILPFQNDKHDEHRKVGAAEHAIATAVAREHQPSQSGCPNREEQRAHDHGLVGDEC